MLEAIRVNEPEPREDLSERLKDFLLQILAKESDERPSLKEMIADDWVVEGGGVRVRSALRASGVRGRVASRPVSTEPGPTAFTRMRSGASATAMVRVI